MCPTDRRASNRDKDTPIDTFPKTQIPNTAQRFWFIGKSDSDPVALQTTHQCNCVQTDRLNGRRAQSVIDLKGKFALLDHKGLECA